MTAGAAVSSRQAKHAVSAGSRSKSIAGGSSVSVEAALSWRIRPRSVRQLGQSPGCPPALTVARPAGPLMWNCSCTCSRPSPSLYTLQTRGVSVRNAACVGWCCRGSAHPTASSLYTTHQKAGSTKQVQRAAGAGGGGSSGGQRQAPVGDALPCCAVLALGAVCRDGGACWEGQQEKWVSG